MPDLLIRGVDEADIRKIDLLAARLGISRSELLRRETVQLANRNATVVTHESLERATLIFSDVLDDEVMRHAW